jgi:hypothetical protein
LSAKAVFVKRHESEKYLKRHSELSSISCFNIFLSPSQQHFAFSIIQITCHDTKVRTNRRMTGEAHATKAYDLIIRKDIGDINVDATKTIERVMTKL